MGPGIGLGPNAMKRLHAWGLKDVLAQRGFVPSHLEVRNALDGTSLGQMAMGDDYLAAFTCGDQLLWGAAEPLRRMLRILVEN